MEFLSELWIPIVVSAAAVWILCAVIWMFMPHRKKEWGGLPNEEQFLQTLRSNSIKPGNYMFPYAGPNCERMKDEAFKKMLKDGPAGALFVWPGTRSMGGCMLASFIFNLVTATFVAYLGWQAFAGRPGVAYLDVFQVTATAAFMAYAFALIPMGIWFNKPVKSIAFDVLEGLAMGLVTGGIFGWLWPSVESAMDANISGAIPG